MGKFLPPHRGHSYLIETASAQVVDVLVLVCARADDMIPAEQRAMMLRELHPTATVLVTPDDLPDNLGDVTSRAWAERTRAAALEVLGRTPDVVFTSEPYGPAFARYLGARHISVDPLRMRYPISGTVVRADPWAAAAFLTPCVRAWFVRRICVLGAESTGTTTLSEDLARHYGVPWVPEYGRTFCAENGGLGIQWRTGDFEHIAREQIAAEDTAARQATRLLICDTDALATSIWHERYLGYRSAVLDTLAASRSYATFLLTSDDIPFVQDGTRDGEHVRGWMTQRLRAALTARPEPWIELRGGRASRVAAAIAHIDALQLIEAA